MTRVGDSRAARTSGQSAVSPRISTGSLPAKSSSNGTRSNLDPSMTRTGWLMVAPSGRLQTGDFQVHELLEIAERGNQEVDRREDAHPVQPQQRVGLERREFLLIDGVIAAEV